MNSKWLLWWKWYKIEFLALPNTHIQYTAVIGMAKRPFSHNGLHQSNAFNARTASRVYDRDGVTTWYISFSFQTNIEYRYWHQPTTDVYRIRTHTHTAHRLSHSASPPIHVWHLWFNCREMCAGMPHAKHIAGAIKNQNSSVLRQLWKISVQFINQLKEKRKHTQIHGSAIKQNKTIMFRPSITIILSSLFVIYISYSIWTMAQLFTNLKCSGTPCYTSILSTKPKLQIALFTSEHSNPLSNQVKELAVFSAFDYHEAFERFVSYIHWCN